MTTPTPGSDPNYPQGGAPQGQPGWGAPQPQGGYQPPSGYGQGGYQPAPSYTGGPAGYGAPTGQRRPGQVTAAAVIAIVWGGLGTLFGLLALFALGIIFRYSGLLGIFVILGFAVSVALLVAGIQVLQGKSPKLLLYLCYASIAIQLLSLIFSLASGYGFEFSSLLGFVIPIVIVAMLLQPPSKQYFASRGLTY